MATKHDAAGAGDLAPTMPKYMFRSECYADIKKLCGILVHVDPLYKIRVTKDADFPDCEGVISTGLSLVRLRSIMVDIPDGHVMAETVQPHDLYDGQRRPF